MNIGVLGTGTVGKAIGDALVALGHDVKMGSRTADSATGTAWATAAGARASHGTFADAAAHGGVVFVCIPGAHVLDVLGAAGDLDGKVLVDLSNPLDFSKGFPPTLSVSNDDSLGERIQRAFPRARVVKTLNTLTAALMLHPDLLPEPTAVFVSGDDQDAKATVKALLAEAGWEQIVDLGGIATARGPEMWLPLWLRTYGALGTGMFNLRIVRA